MAWKDELRALRTGVHEAFQWEAVLHHNTAGDLDCRVKWHREGDLVGRDNMAQMMLENHELVFLLEDLEGNALERGTLVSVQDVDEVTVQFMIMDTMDDNGYQQIATVEIQ